MPIERNRGTGKGPATPRQSHENAEPPGRKAKKEVTRAQRSEALQQRAMQAPPSNAHPALRPMPEEAAAGVAPTRLQPAEPRVPLPTMTPTHAKGAMAEVWSPDPQIELEHLAKLPRALGRQPPPGVAAPVAASLPSPGSLDEGSPASTRPDVSSGAAVLGAALAAGTAPPALMALAPSGKVQWTAIPTGVIATASRVDGPPPIPTTGQSARVKSNKFRSNIKTHNHSGKLRPIVVSTLTLNQSGRNCYCSNTIERGGYGGIRYGWAAGERVAIKALRLHKKTDLQNRAIDAKTSVTLKAALDKEIKALNLMKVSHDFVTDGTTAYIVRSYRPGDANALMRRLKMQTLPANEREYFVLRMLQTMSASVADVHRAGIAHFDLKPDNFLFDLHGQMEAIDFGLCEFVDPITHRTPTIRAGTPGFMSPEVIAAFQMKETPMGPSADMWSMGIIALEALTGKRSPLSRAGGPQQLMAQCNQFINWHASLVVSDNSVSVDGSEQGPTLNLDGKAFAKGDWGHYLRKVKNDSKPLLLTILRHLTQPDASLRMSASTMHLEMTARLTALREVLQETPSRKIILQSLEERWLHAAQRTDSRTERIFSVVKNYADAAEKVALQRKEAPRTDAQGANPSAQRTGSTL
jgi:serine/threonine protein kinase